MTPPKPEAPRILLLLLLALAHLGLWLLLDGRLWRGGHATEAGRRSELRVLLPLLPVQPPLKARSRPVAAARSARITVPAVPAAPAAAQPDIPTPAQASAAPPAPTPTPEPAPESLLGSEATRRAIRQASRTPLLAERAASAMGDAAPQRPEDKLGQQIQQAASGDCLKGEFAGAGMGLLSLPFWALAEARGKCRR